MNETSKSCTMRRARGDFARYLHGRGIDIGAGGDPLRVPHGRVTRWDRDCGDAQYMASVPDAFFDFVYSSHCLEHLEDVPIALKNWTRILRPGGFLYLVVPDFELYEKRAWPPRFNQTHRHTFSMEFTRGCIGRLNHWHIFEDVEPALGVLGGVRVVEKHLEDAGFDYSMDWRVDQTRNGALAQICIVGRKRTKSGA